MANHLVLEDSPSVVAAWLRATKALSTVSRPVYNLVYTIIAPPDNLPCDTKVVTIFDKFAVSHAFHPTATVANTIFPLDTYLAKRRGGSQEFYDYYLEAVLPRVRKRWGTYFERMIIRKNDDGTAMMKGNRQVNPLDILIEKLKRRIDTSRGTTTHYEVSIEEVDFEIATYDPQRDSSYPIGGPCLSHLSFKIERNNALRMTAIYRSHWYIERALGNLIGLARLQWFVASAAGATVGPLTIIASEAVLDLGGKSRTTADTRTMLADCWAAGGTA